MIDIGFCYFTLHHETHIKVTADGHHDEIGHHLVVADELAERFDHAADLVVFVYQFVIGFLGGEVPVPRVFERRDLRFAFSRSPDHRFTAFGPKNYVV